MKKEENIWDDIHKKLRLDVLKHSSYAQECEPLFPRNSMVCDLGGGLGFDALYFLKKGHKVVMLDISNFALNNAKELAKKEGLEKNLLVKQADFGLGKLPLKDFSFDVVYSRIGLNYFPYRETQLLFSEVYRILKHNGTAYTILKSPEDKDEMKFLKSNGVEMEEGTYIEGGQIRSRFNINQLENLLKEIGIKDFTVTAYSESNIITGKDNIAGGRSLFLNNVIFTKK